VDHPIGLARHPVAWWNRRQADAVALGRGGAPGDGGTPPPGRFSDVTLQTRGDEFCGSRRESDRCLFQAARPVPNGGRLPKVGSPAPSRSRLGQIPHHMKVHIPQSEDSAVFDAGMTADRRPVLPNLQSRRGPLDPGSSKPLPPAAWCGSQRKCSTARNSGTDTSDRVRGTVRRYSRTASVHRNDRQTP
jgi:hypothetical protein